MEKEEENIEKEVTNSERKQANNVINEETIIITTP